jgi:hypothetical protein
MRHDLAAAGKQPVQQQVQVPAAARAQLQGLAANTVGMVQQVTQRTGRPRGGAWAPAAALPLLLQPQGLLPCLMCSLHQALTCPLGPLQSSARTRAR